MDGLGIHSISNIFRDFGYVARDTLTFPGKKLTALWFAPPTYESTLPRIFVSELKARLSPSSAASPESLDPTCSIVLLRLMPEDCSKGFLVVCAACSILTPPQWKRPSADVTCRWGSCRQRPQEVIAKYTCQMGGLAGRYAPMSAATGVLPWTSPCAGGL